MGKLPEDQSHSPLIESHTSTTVTIEERSTLWKERGEHPNWKIYSVDIQTPSGKVDFADIFTDEYGASFIWPGSIDFATLEETALGKVSSLLTESNQILRGDEQATQKATKVVFTTLWKNDTIREYSLSNKRHLQRYHNLLARPDKIIFARYDVASPTLTYSFTAINIEATEDAREYPELAIRISYGKSFHEDVVKWAAQTHKDAASFTLDEQTLQKITKGVNETVETDRQTVHPFSQ